MFIAHRLAGIVRCRSRSIAVVAAVVLIGQSASAAAQERSGLWGGLGGGYGAASASSDEIGSGDREGAGVAYFNVGWTLNNQTLIGGEFNIWSKTEELEGTVADAKLKLYNASVTLTFYPSDTSRFFVKGGAGMSAIDFEAEALDTRITADLGTGFGYIVGAGYDIPAGPISITPAINFWGGNIGELEFQGVTLFTDWQQNVVDFTIGIKFN